MNLLRLVALLGVLLIRAVAAQEVTLQGRVRAAKSSGGAQALLQRIDRQHPGKVNRIVRKSWHGTRGQLMKQLDQDSDLTLDLENEALVYECQGLNPPPSAMQEVQEKLAAEQHFAAAAASELGSNMSPTDADPAASQAFNLASRPAATNKLWLDFKGGNITNTAWNSYNPTIVIPPWDTDNNPSTFSTTELNAIVAIWRAVAEDYAPFNVDVTTIPPGPSVPATTYMRVCIGGKGEWYGSAGGVAFVNSFGSGAYYQPAFVFPKNLGPDYPKFVWEAVSHEAGHTMGLQHDGDASTAYYQGHGNWAPIMGVGYYKQVTQWSKGEYTGANQLQDDVAIIANKLGLAPQQNGNSIATATPLNPQLAGTTATATASGIVAQAGVADFFQLTAGAGSASITADVTAPWYDAGRSSSIRSNLDVQVTIYDATGVALRNITPDGLTVPSTAFTLPAAGAYYVAVSGSGYANPSSTGYSSYGSLGQFSIRVTYPAGSGTNPQQAVDCVGAYGAWGACSAICGGGTQSATYTITTPAANGGKACEAVSGAVKTQACNTQPCPVPVDCVGSYGPWSACSATCGGGVQTATFTITTAAANGGKQCQAVHGAVQTQACNTQPCAAPVDCVGSFSTWSACSATCGGGVTTATYTITTPAANGGRQCPFAHGYVQSTTCNTLPCPVDCVGSYSAWSACNATCGGGVQSATYTVTRPAVGSGTVCEAANGFVKIRACNTQPCPVSSPSPSPSPSPKPSASPSPSPSPSPAPSPSPSPAPSPSPSPAPGPSPNPVPSPSPSPSPRPLPTMYATVSVQSMYDPLFRRYFCRAVVSVKSKGAPVARAVVRATWSSSPVISSFASNAAGYTGTTGSYTAVSRVLPSTATGTTRCIFTVASVTKAGYIMSSLPAGRLPKGAFAVKSRAVALTAPQGNR